MKKAIWILGIVVVLGAGYGAFRAKSRAAAAPQIEFTEVTRGSIESTISTTGEINPVSTVEVGTQVSGIISKIYVDFNDLVRKGQVMAVLDTTILASTVRDARASLLKAQAQYDEAQREYTYYKELFDGGYISEYELLGYETAVKTTKASLQSARTTLEKAEVNLGYAVIRSPISGKVIDREVEEGQTVAASYSTPTLFTIAEDLSHIEIHAKVDESDIGQITVGQKVRFGVETYYGRTFPGVVRQLRLQPETVSNVVTYTVVVDASNPDDLLLPGMTATIDFIVASRENVLLVSNNALRVEATDEMTASASGAPAAPGKSGGNTASAAPDTASGGNKTTQPVLWVRDGGRYVKIPVQKGITDGKVTEILENGQINEGMKVIESVVSAADQKTSASTSRAGMPPMGGMMRR